MAVAIYARKSTESEDRQIQSLDDQLSALHELAKRENLKVSEIIVESRSAKEPYTRPEFQRLMGKVQSGEIEGILTWAINRLSRNMVDGGLIAHLLQAGTLKFIRTPERTYLPEDNVLLMSIENGMATGYIQDLSRNVKRGMKGKAERGWHTCKAPLGYINNPITREIDPDPVKFELVNKAWSLLLSGNYNLPEIHRELTKLGLKGAQKRDREKPISKSLFYKLFSNPFYAGSFYFKGELLKGKHQPMISWDQFERAQVLLGRTPLRRMRTHEHLFSGVFVCRNCGCSNIGETKRKEYASTGRQAIYTYYHCSATKGCRKVGKREKEIYDIGFDIVSKVKINPIFNQWAKYALQHVAEEDREVISVSLPMIEQKILTLDSRLKSARNKVVDETITADDYREIKAEVEPQLAKANQAKNELLTESERINRYVEEKLDIAEKASRFETLEITGKRGLFRSLGKTHYLTLGNLEFDIDPVLQKIASCERLKDGSESPQLGEFVPANSFWWSLIRAMRKIAKEQLLLDSTEKARG